MNRVTLRAAAKINLDLRVGARGADGYHRLHTIFQTLDLHDTLVITRVRGPFALEGDSRLMPLDRTNLVWRAADSLWRAAKRAGGPSGVRIRVIKRIPSQAGLGGGSSDAASALVGLSRVWRLPGTLEHLMPIAASLGADVAFFLVGGTALGLGRGQQLFPLIDRPPRYVVLATHGPGVSTADAYRWLAASRGRRTVELEICGPPRNDLEPPVEARHPVIAQLRRRLMALGAETARMSGSGSAVFGLFRTELAARRAASSLAASGHAVWLTRTRARNQAETRRLGCSP